jgi:hypothetical protein
MINAKLLNPDASLNDYFFIGSLNFVPGENLTVAIQIFDAHRKIRYIPPATAELTMTFINKDGSELVKTASVIDADDRSMWKAEISQAESELLAGQNVEISLDPDGDGDPLMIALLANAIIRVNLSGDC